LQSLGIDYTLDTTTDNEKITMIESCDADEIIIVMFNSNTTHVPTAPTAVAGTNNNQIATTAYVDVGLALKTDLTYAEYLMMEGDPA